MRWQSEGIPILGTSPDAIDLAEDRERFQKLLHKLGLKQPVNGIARIRAQALRDCRAVGYPLVIRPSYVLGGRAMEIVRDDGRISSATSPGGRCVGQEPGPAGQLPVRRDRGRCGCAVRREAVHVAGIMEHIEEAGVHSGDSACCLPPHSLSRRDHRRTEAPDRGDGARAECRGA
jgi:carbamoyl-phosphate synthase large subunit